jgi:hypothetical protein
VPIATAVDIGILLLDKIEVGLNCVGYKDIVGLSKPTVDGSVDQTHLKPVNKTLSDGLRLGLPKPIIIEASSLPSPLANSKARGIGGKPARGRGFRVYNLTHSRHEYFLMWRATSRGGVSLSSKHMARGSSAQTMEPLLALSSSPKAPVAT